MSTPAIVINGTSGAYEQPSRFGWDTSGPYCIRTWKGTASAISTQYDTCAAAGALVEVENGYGTSTLRARYAVTITGGTEAPVDAWEFFASHAEKDILEADLPAINALTNQEKSDIREAIANPASDIWGDFSDEQLAVYGLMVSGVKAVRVMAPVLRHTQTVSNIFTVKAALTDVGKILSSGTLATFESIPSSVLFNLPYDTSSRTAPALAYGWMKMHPTIRMAARQKMQIELEYEYGLWSTLLYGSPL